MERESFQSREGVHFAGIAHHIQQKLEGRRMTCGADSAEEYEAVVGIALVGEGFLKERCGAGESGGSECQGRLFSYRAEFGM